MIKLIENGCFYENGVLTHEDSSSGPWKTFTINESDYLYAFPLQ